MREKSTMPSMASIMQAMQEQERQNKSNGLVYNPDAEREKKIRVILEDIFKEKLLPIILEELKDLRINREEYKGVLKILSESLNKAIV